ncbi:MAG: hypothetical protein NTV28_09500 [Propionibacteriales bacterium]|nr:hypothetical protein [Propionibacteriales bacterium]
MTKPAQLALGAALVVAGVVVAVTIPEKQFLVFTGRPFGVILAIVGAFDIAEALYRDRRRGD